MSDHTDRVELTDAEIWSVLNATGIWYSTTPGIHKRVTAAVESIVAARLSALTAERDELQQQIERGLVEYNGLSVPAVLADAIGQRDAARAELAAANARCAELERDVRNVTDWAMTREAERDALQARLDRVTAAFNRFLSLPHDYSSTFKGELHILIPDREIKELFAALADSGTKDGSNDERQ